MTSQRTDTINQPTNTPYHLDGKQCRSDNKHSQLTDMHCHLAFAKDAKLVATQLSEAHLPVFTNTVEPQEWRQCSDLFATCSEITVGYGWHPWWVTERSTPQELCNQLERFQPKALGEIGLDFGLQHSATKEQQVIIFQTFAKWATKKQDCLLSIHAVQATTEVLEILNELQVFNTCKCIFHWFSGTSEDLSEAIARGCFFSVNQRMIKNKKGHEYVRQIPLDRLLLESDLPNKQHDELTVAELIDTLEDTLTEISRIKEVDCAAPLNKTASLLLEAVHN